MVTRSQYARPSAVPLNLKSKWIVDKLRLMSPPDSTNLEELARFQQKQLQEKEQKLLQLYDQQQQRAHQVAQRGSAGSSGSNGSGGSGIIKPTPDVRQLFEERRQQSNVKGIDKSYPLEPLNGRSKKKQTTLETSNARRNNNNNGNNNNNAQPAAARRGATKTNGTMHQPANNNRAAAVSRESYASTRSSGGYKDSSIQRESFTRESYASSRGDYDEPSESSRQQSNGHARHYEINIDEVIDNDAMERNRLLAKFHQVDIERRSRQFDIENEDIPGDETYFGSRRSSLDPNPRNAAAVAATLKSNNNAKKSGNAVAPVTAAANATKKPTAAIPTGTRQSTVMKTTKSASLKIRKKAPLPRRTLEARPRSTSLGKIDPGKDSKTKLQEDVMSKSLGCSGSWDNRETLDWDTLKSTSLIFEMIRKASRIGDGDKIGKVKKMVTKIEESIPENKSSTENQQLQEPSTSPINDSDLCKSDTREPIKVSSSDQEILPSNIIESEDQGDGLIEREEINSLAQSIRGKRECSVEHPSEYQEIVVANQTIEKPIKENRPKRVRRASFELKRMMFEQIQGQENFQRHDSVESALRHFDSIGVVEPVPTTELDNSQKDRRCSTTFRLCSKEAIKRKNDSALQSRGFERHTSAWSIRTSKDGAAYRHVKPAARRAFYTRRKLQPAASSGKKLLEARDSIELARVPVKTRLPACRRKILLVSNSRAPPPATDNDADTTSMKNQSSKSRETRVARLKSIFSREQTCLNNDHHDFSSPSTTRNGTDSRPKKSVAPYPSSKSPDNHVEKSRPYGSSLKFLSRLDGSNGELENGFSTDNDQKQSGFSSIAARNSNSNSSVAAAGKSHGNTTSRLAAKAKAAPPTPAARSTPKASPASNDDSLSTCKICSRRFATDRIGLHEQICAKTSQKKRKQFDAVTHRVKGTELESFVQKPSRKQGKASKAVAAPVETSSKSNWRRKHEDFINAIRSAKQMQAHLASGGKLSDLPPPPPSDTSDYIQCPHCSRKFNQAAAERHIPKCENMQHNKPNPRAPPRSRR